MKAIRLHEYGAADTLRYEEVAPPTAGPGQVVVRVHAASYNPIDSKLASGYLHQFRPLTFPWIPGSDFAGIIAAVGKGVASLLPGQAVYGTCSGGGAYAEYVVAEAATPKPATLSFAEAASVPVVALTAWQGLRLGGHLQAGQTVLIHGGAGAVGGYAVQVAHQLGAHVIATAAGADRDFVRSLGADEVLDIPRDALRSGCERRGYGLRPGRRADAAPLLRRA
jgi:NADPH:quinone reductase-like Zn-dependent oxidoreductase